MEVSLALLADAANTSSDGKLNILGVFQRISAAKFPATHPRLVLVLGFQADLAERGSAKDLEVKLLDEDGKQLLSITGQMKVPTSVSGGRQFEWWQHFQINGLKFEKPGDYAFVVLIGGETKRRVPLRIDELQPKS